VLMHSSLPRGLMATRISKKHNGKAATVMPAWHGAEMPQPGTSRQPGNWNGNRRDRVFLQKGVHDPWIRNTARVCPIRPLSPDPDHPELGFWEVETSSLRYLPQQFHTFVIVRNSDNTVSIFTTDVDPSVRDGSLAAKSRSYAIATHQIFNTTIGPMPSGSYNAELVKQLMPEMQVKIQSYGTPVSR
jgi:hypothetical protein